MKPRHFQICQASAAPDEQYRIGRDIEEASDKDPNSE
jgi:hypothetical protein